jgi:hypothetical protein
MLKLYKRIEGVLHYHEAWEDDGKIVEHWGKAGLKGKFVEHPAPATSGARALRKVLKPALEKGYAPVPARRMAVVLVEYVIKGFGTPADLKKRHELEDLLNEVLGWTGLGHCDGGSIGSGTMGACCFVVDAELARRVLKSKLKGTRFANYSRIYVEGP